MPAQGSGTESQAKLIHIFPDLMKRRFRLAWRCPEAAFLVSGHRRHLLAPCCVLVH